MKLSGDAEASVLLRQRLPKDWMSLGNMREAGRAINLLFPDVVIDYVSVKRPVAQARKVRSL